MKTLWKFVNKLRIKQSAKRKLFVIFFVLINIMIGGSIWFLLGRFFLSEIGWLWCFIGYPAVLVGLLGGILYLYNHEF